MERKRKAKGRKKERKKVKPVNKQVRVVSQSSDGLAVNDDALLEELKLREPLVLPREPQPEVVVDVGGFVDPALKKEKSKLC